MSKSYWAVVNTKGEVLSLRNENRLALFDQKYAAEVWMKDFFWIFHPEYVRVAKVEVSEDGNV
jgi:hypothetical protein